jgi:hypothetical protein
MCIKNVAVYCMRGRCGGLVERGSGVAEGARLEGCGPQLVARSSCSRSRSSFIALSC